MRKSAVVAVALWFVLCPVSVAQQPAKTPIDVASANALLDEFWDWSMREYPHFATLFGDHRYDDRLRDESAAAVAKRKAFYADFRRRLADLDISQLPVQVRTSMQVLRYRIDRIVALNEQYGSLPFGPYDAWSPVTQMEGIHLDLPNLVNRARFRTVGDYEAYLKRLDAVPTSIDHLIARMEVAMAAGWLPPQAAIRNVPKQLEAQLNPDPTRSPEYVPFNSFPDSITPTERQRLSMAAQRVIRDKVVPAFQSLKTFYESRYLTAARATLGASSLPPGPPFYQALLDWNTTTALNPTQIHELGLREVARIGAQMDAIVPATGFKGSRAEFRKFISTDPQFFYTKAEDMLAGYRDIAKRADAELPKFFAELPRLPTASVRWARRGQQRGTLPPGAAQAVEQASSRPT